MHVVDAFYKLYITSLCTLLFLEPYKSDKKARMCVCVFVAFVSYGWVPTLPCSQV